MKSRSVRRKSPIQIFFLVALLAQSVEHATFNRGVGGSSPPQGFFCAGGEVAKRSNALGSGPSPSGSRVRFSPSSLVSDMV